MTEISRLEKARKYILLLSLYLCQGLPFGFFMQGGPAILRKQGADLKSITLLSLFALPYAFKPLWAPIVDRTLTRATWIRSLQIATLIALIVFTLFPTLSIVHLCGFFLIANLLAATQDIATDGLAVNVLDHNERGIGNAIQVGGYRVGMIIGGGYILGFFDTFGWSGCFALIAAIFGLATLPAFVPWFKPIIEHEPEADPETAEAEEAESGESATWTFFKIPGIWGWLLVVILVKQADYLASGVVKPWLVDNAISLENISYYYGTLGSVAGLVGAVLGGPAVQRLGRRKALILLFFLQYVCLLHTCYMAWFRDLSEFQLLLNSILEHLPGGMATVALFTCMMDVCRPKYAGHDYSWQASILVFVNIGANAISGRCAAATGYTSHFFTSCQLGMLTVLCIILWANFGRGAAIFGETESSQSPATT